MLKEAIEYLFGTYQPIRLLEGLDTDVAAVVPGVKVESLERFQAQPDRIRAAVALASLTSFCEYINRFKTEESSVYLDVGNGVFEAVLDHHGENEPHWCQHRAKFQPKKSREWESWNELHDKWLGQIHFGEAIENLLDTIHEPEPNKVLQAALKFQAVNSMTLVSHHNLDDGTANFHFKKDNAHEDVTFPHRVKLWLPVYENEDPNLHDARIRFRNTEGVLTFKFSFVKEPGTVERDELRDIANKTTAATDGLAHYEGTAPQGRKGPFDS